MVTEERLKELLTQRRQLTAIQKDDGWIEWGGGECPVDEESAVDVMQRNGALMLGEPAGCFEWKHGNAVLHESPMDIVAYRIVGPRTNTN